eukprot:gnl/MRDRNA2_/MRDRNA2_101628_c0_seq1.p1 gnl/MRDRNA2_/MRDRNA2_101628_c0~~gnl/MRDRNA2_/MRDRNA2_101628_c0_seq1.p1  ORF type:complete len:348 (+),score=72.54 gnl/MRDRNA2_/MRDRNA2_101628_c0_seq1:89-1132(+)
MTKSHWAEAGLILCMVMSGCLFSKRSGSHSHQLEATVSQALEAGLNHGGRDPNSSDSSQDLKKGDKVKIVKAIAYDPAVLVLNKRGTVANLDRLLVQLAEDYKMGERVPRDYSSSDLKFQDPRNGERSFRIGDAVVIIESGKWGIIWGVSMLEIDVCQQSVFVGRESLESATQIDAGACAADPTETKKYAKGDRIKIVRGKNAVGLIGEVVDVGILFVQTEDDFKKGLLKPRGYMASDLLFAGGADSTQKFKKGDMVIINKKGGSSQKGKKGVIWADSMIRVETCTGFRREDHRLAKSVSVAANDLAPKKEADVCPGEESEQEQEKSSALGSLAFSSLALLYWFLTA